MANAIKIDPKAYSAEWKEKDEALLIDLLQRKIQEMRWEISDADSPYMRSRLKDKRKEYKVMLDKVRRGQYNGNVIMSELSAAVVYQKAKDKKKETVLSKYVSSYDDVDFDFKTYFGKTRYYGVALPFIIFMLMLVFIGVIMMSAFVPTATIDTIEGSMSSDKLWLSLSNIGFMKLDEGRNDFLVPNDGNWPQARWATQVLTEKYEPYNVGNQSDAQGRTLYQKKTYAAAERPTVSREIPAGVPYAKITHEIARDANNAPMTDSSGSILYVRVEEVPANVYLCRDAGIVSIDLTAFDMMRAIFRTRLFAQYRVDIIEDLEVMSGRSWFYQRYLNSRADEIVIERDLQGNYDPVAIIKYVATYASIYSIWLAVGCALITIISCIFRMFSYTSRKLHVFSLLTLVFTLIAFVTPALLDIQASSASAFTDALKSYFLFDATEFLSGGSQLMCNLLFMALLVMPLLCIIAPAFFRNRRHKDIIIVPKGNKPPRRPQTATATATPIKQGVPLTYTPSLPIQKRK